MSPGGLGARYAQQRKLPRPIQPSLSAQQADPVFGLGIATWLVMRPYCCAFLHLLFCSLVRFEEERLMLHQGHLQAAGWAEAQISRS